MAGKRIGIDFHILDQKYQGSRTYLVNIISHLKQIDHQNTYVIYVNNLDNIKSHKKVYTGQENFSFKQFVSKNALFRLSWEIPLIVKQDKLDIFHTQYICPLISRVQQVVTIHDILFETHPEFFSKLFVARSKVLVRMSAHKAARILTDSQFSKSQIMELYKVPEGKITVLYGGIDKERFNTIKKDQAKVHIAEKYGLQKYILNVGRLEPRKNQLSLIKAYHSLLMSNKIEHKLVIIGPKDFRYGPIFAYISQNRLDDFIHIFSNIEDHELPDFYKASDLFIYPSIAEGFGLPALEAMACGIPVIGSDSTSIPEVIGAAGMLIDPFDVEKIADVIHAVLSKEELAKELSDKALRRACQFNWEDAAQNTFRIYSEL
jgi:glycosyltransferase involved in cell wall biosynthesis